MSSVKSLQPSASQSVYGLDSHLFLLSDMSRIRRKFRRYHRPNPRLNQRNRLCRSHLTQYLPSRSLMHIGHRYQV